MHEPVVTLSKLKSHLALVTLNRPASLNAINSEVLTQLGDILAQLSANQDLRVVIFNGAGSKAFCAGADLKERKGLSAEAAEKFVALIGKTMADIAALPMPTIAAIDGVAFGGGLELALACDLRVIHYQALVGLTECSLGIIPGAGGTQRLARIAGVSVAKEMIFGALRIDGVSAQQKGLANQVATETSALDLALALAGRIAANAPLSVRAAKKAVDEGLDMPLERGLQHEQQCYQSILHTEDRLEALAAFSEKRLPNFRGQ